MPRYVVLFHEVPNNPGASNPVPPQLLERGNHWDLMLEDDGQLATWEFSIKPCAGLIGKARRLPGHRISYLDYQGAISGNRGHVSRVLSGSFEWITRKEDQWTVRLTGSLDAMLELIRVDPQDQEGEAEWWQFKIA